MRGGGPLGRFDARYEMGSIYEGMADDLQHPAGQVINWYRFSEVSSRVDDIYDVGNQVVGRVWNGPIPIPVLSIRITQNALQNVERGFYATNSVIAHVSVDILLKLLGDVLNNPDIFMNDRFVYRNALWEPDIVFPKGAVTTHLTVVTIHGRQMKTDQAVNDETFKMWPETNL